MLYSSMFSAVKKKMNGKQEKFECYIEKNGFVRPPKPTEKWISSQFSSDKADFHRAVPQFCDELAFTSVKF